MDLLDINFDVQDIPFSSDESQEIATEQHRDMIEGLVNKSSRLYKLISECDIVACEKDFVYKFPLPFDVVYKGEHYGCVYIIGSIDLLLKDHNGDLIVVDYKSGAKKFDMSKLKNNLQLPIYSLVVRQIYGRLPARTMYYFTRFDEFQEVSSIAESKDDVEITYYKNGKVKTVQRCVEDIQKTLLGIFEKMYRGGKYPPSTTPLCCWCPFQYAYGEIGDCKYGNVNYYRKDIPLLRQQEVGAMKVKLMAKRPVDIPLEAK